MEGANACFNCNGTGHKAAECPLKDKKRQIEANNDKSTHEQISGNSKWRNIEEEQSDEEVHPSIESQASDTSSDQEEESQSDSEAQPEKNKELNKGKSKAKNKKKKTTKSETNDKRNDISNSKEGKQHEGNEEEDPTKANRRGRIAEKDIRVYLDKARSLSAKRHKPDTAGSEGDSPARRQKGDKNKH
ncbi:hypothetical protein ElyMa_001754100 [Elysia marginata]|uniref:CCHC-type domain-containing protein n=1 Tax=Elysia marginata TaxID=1093978 RepID=A0AAV4E9X9_9GAST|nr:hypothetical protein ElyMa_001754100 [Elysia marginata]